MLILVRHGRTELNEAGRVQGAIDWPLSQQGLAEVERLAEWLSRLQLNRPHLLSSDALRARQTAEVLGSHLQVRLSIIKGVHERDFGPFEGLDRPELLKKRLLPPDTSKDIIERWAGVPEVETDASLLSRALPAVEPVVAAALDPDEDVVLVTHSGVIEVLLSHMLQLPTTHKWIKIPPASSVGLLMGPEEPRLSHLWPNPHI